LLPVEQCPISSPLINRGIAALWQSGRAGKAVDGVREVELFAAADAAGNETQLLLELLCAPEARRAAVRHWAEELCAAMSEIAGVVAFREPQKGMQEPLVTVGASHLTYQTPSSSHRVSAGSFFQTNRFLVDELLKVVTAGCSGALALDLYAGVGLFSTALARDIRHVVSVESSQTAAADLQYNSSVRGKAVQATAGQYLGVARVGRASAGMRSRNEASKVRDNKETLPLEPLPKPDLVVVDPPRAGLGDAVAGAVAALSAPRVIYVSCDPATLARDLVPLQAAGYHVEEVHLIDLFPQTYHLETVIQLIR
jgi:23S rRNA (uracil1939-C5)-methyltransferase